MEAEKEATRIVQKSRQYRVQRLKDARSEAAKEIEELKAQRMKEFKDMEGTNSGTSDKMQVQMEKETEAKLKEVQGMYEKNKEEVLKMILDTVLNVDTSVHANVAFAQKYSSKS